MTYNTLPFTARGIGGAPKAVCRRQTEPPQSPTGALAPGTPGRFKKDKKACLCPLSLYTERVSFYNLLHDYRNQTRNGRR